MDLKTRFDYAREAGRLEAQAVTGNDISIQPLSRGWERRFEQIRDDNELRDMLRGVRLEALDDCRQAICPECRRDAQGQGAFMERDDATGAWTHITVESKPCLAASIRDYEYQQRVTS
jgi:hypothetical protein